jgi:hypothetical protein
VISTIAVFVPVIEFHVGGKKLVGKTEAMSLWELNTSQEKLLNFLANFRENKARKAGAKIADKIGGKFGGKIGSTARDLRDSLEGVDSIKDEDVRTLGTILSVATYSLLALNLLALAILFGDTVKGRFRRWRVVIALIASFLTTGLTISLGLGFSFAADQGNVEIGRNLLTTRAGVYMMPIAGTLAFIAAIVLLVQLIRASGSTRPMASAPPQQPPQQPPPPPPPAGPAPA